ncbi:MAG TPA: sulfotransferase [Rubrobacter sp.]|nr:sulfotransferase [Rubrobacter sp.]
MRTTLEAIGAGFGRTGTMSLNVVLEELGFGACYHMSEVFSPPPYLIQASPQDGATGVSRSTNTRVTFSEAIDLATINGSTFQLHFYDFLCDRSTATCTLYSYQIPATVRKDPTDTTGRTYLLGPYDATSTLLSATGGTG